MRPDINRWATGLYQAGQLHQAIYERDRAATRAAFIVIEGTVQHGGGATNVLAERVRTVE